MKMTNNLSWRTFPPMISAVAGLTLLAGCASICMLYMTSLRWTLAVWNDSNASSVLDKLLTVAYATLHLSASSSPHLLSFSLPSLSLSPSSPLPPSSLLHTLAQAWIERNTTHQVRSQATWEELLDAMAAPDGGNNLSLAIKLAKEKNSEWVAL